MVRQNVALLLLSIFVFSADAEGGGRGFGDDYEWRKLDEGLKEAESTSRPAMLVFHKSWCGACKALGPQFAGSSEIKELASNFVMINIHDDEEPADAHWRPDGGYIPRVLFYDGLHGEPLPDFICENCNPKFKYYYSDPAAIAATMRRVKAHLDAEDAKVHEAAQTLADAAAAAPPAGHAEL